MLDLFTLKENNKINKKLTNNFYKTPKHFPSSLREWKNSIFVYNKNTLNLIPSTTITVNNIIKSYFNLFNKKLEAKIRTRRLLMRLRRLSSNKYYISNGGFKHSNNKVIINLYIFNRQKTNYLLALKKLYFKTFLKKTTKESNINIRLIKRLKLINTKGIEAIKLLNKNNYLFIKALNSILENKNYKKNNFRELSLYTENFYKNLINKSLKKIKMYFYYKQLLYINKSKLNYTYLQNLKKYLERIYNKNVEFNIINIKRFYLNSDILSESITTKLSRNRRKISRYLYSLTNKVVVKKKSFFNKSIQKNKLILQESIMDELKYKYVTGFRLEAKGRLSRRFTASRSVYKLKYKGNLLNLDSSYKGLSSVLLKGNLKSNTQYSILKSKSRIGSFGIKGWVSGN